MFVRKLLLGSMLWAVSSVVAIATAPEPCIVEVQTNRVRAVVADCPVKDFLRILCEKLDCNLFVDPGIHHKISLKIDNQNIEKALALALKSVDYMVEWETVIDPKGRRRDRVTSISAYREGHREEVVPFRARRSVSDRPPALTIDERELESLKARLAEGNDPNDVREAALALARNGSAPAIKALLDALPLWDTNEDLSDPVSQAVLTIANRAAAADLLREYLAEDDESVSLATRYALSKMADQGILDMLAKTYAETEDVERREKLAELIGAISCKDAQKGLLKLSGAVENPPETPLQWAAIRALANMGSAPSTDHLLERLDLSREEDSDELTELVRNVSASQTSIAALRYAAAGNKRFKSDKIRVSAIMALSRFQDRQTMDVLNRLAGDANAAIRQAALSVLKGGE